MEARDLDMVARYEMGSKTKNNFMDGPRPKSPLYAWGTHAFTILLFAVGCCLITLSLRNVLYCIRPISIWIYACTFK